MGHCLGRQALIGTQPTGAIEGIVITGRLGDGPSIIARGQTARLAVVLDDCVIAVGEDVAREFETVAMESYRNLLRGHGWVRVLSEALPFSVATLARASTVISAVSHKGPTVTVDGQPAQFAIIADHGVMFAVGQVVAREVEAVVVNAYRDYLIELGLLRRLPVPATLDSAPS
jgi:hypothetical protein